MKKYLAKTIITAASVMLLTASANAAVSVNADISPFEHNLVFTDFYNYAVEYPVLLYKNVSYIPMTSSMCNELYLSIAFTPEEGLYIARGGGRDNIGRERTQVLGAIDYINPADGKVTAVIPDYPVYINGRKYENTEYPCLNFRDITYLPLTYDIIKNEFDFDFEFDNTAKKLTLHGNSWYSAPYFISSNDEYIEIREHKSVYSESINEYGDTKYTLEYDYDEYYRLNIADDSVEKLPDGYIPPKQENKAEKEPDPRFTVKDGYAYFEDFQLVQIPEYRGESWHYDGSASAEIYDYEDTSFIVVTTWVNIALPSGTTREHHIFVKDEKGICELPWGRVFSELIYDGKGAWYLYSSSGNSWKGNAFSDIYRYTKENGLERLSDRYENLNSLQLIGVHDGKMYVFGALRDGEEYRDVSYSGESLNPMYSGYYAIDENLDITKIAPYMGARAEAVLAENGKLYLMTNYSSDNRLINLMSGEILYTFG